MTLEDEDKHPCCVLCGKWFTPRYPRQAASVDLHAECARIPESLRDSVRRAVAASERPLVDVKAWADRLAEDIANATEEG